MEVLPQWCPNRKEFHFHHLHLTLYWSIGLTPHSSSLSLFDELSDSSDTWAMTFFWFTGWAIDSYAPAMHKGTIGVPSLICLLFLHWFLVLIVCTPVEWGGRSRVRCLLTANGTETPCCEFCLRAWRPSYVWGLPPPREGWSWPGSDLRPRSLLSPWSEAFTWWSQDLLARPASQFLLLLACEVGTQFGCARMLASSEDIR